MRRRLFIQCWHTTPKLLKFQLQELCRSSSKDQRQPSILNIARPTFLRRLMATSRALLNWDRYDYEILCQASLTPRSDSTYRNAPAREWGWEPNYLNLKILNSVFDTSKVRMRCSLSSLKDANKSSRAENSNTFFPRYNVAAVLRTMIHNSESSDIELRPRPSLEINKTDKPFLNNSSATSGSNQQFWPITIWRAWSSALIEDVKLSHSMALLPHELPQDHL